MAALTVSSAFAFDCMRDSLSASLKSATSLALGFLDSASAMVRSLRALSSHGRPVGAVPVENLNQRRLSMPVLVSVPSLSASWLLCRRLTCS